MCYSCADLEKHLIDTSKKSISSIPDIIHKSYYDEVGGGGGGGGATQCSLYHVT